MTFPHTPQEPSQFNALCQQIDEYETLPEATAVPWEQLSELSETERTESLDAEILAGLVSP